MADLRKSGLAFAKAFKQASSEADAALAAEKAARMAQLVESERALPLRLPRATPKTKEELGAHAERVGRQMLGEHVTSGKKGDTKNLAGRSMKENQRVRELEYELSPTKDIPQSQPYEARIGDINVAFPGDYTVSDVELKTLRGQPVGSRQQGGSRYGLGKLDQDEPLFWASSEMPAQLAQDKITDVAHLYEPERVMAHHLAMGPVATNFAQHFADANLRAIDYSKLRKKDMDTFDRIIAGGYDKKNPKTGVIETVAFPNWPGIADPEAAYAAMKADPELRKWFNNRMKTPSVTEATNMPNGLDVQWAITAPELRNMEVNLTGHSVGEMVPSAKLTDTAEHETYSKGIRGKYAGHQDVLTPFQISFPDAAQHISSTQRPQDFTGTIQKVFPHQVVDQQYLDELGEYKRRLEKVLTGKKKGGAMTNRDDYQARLDDMISKHMAGGGGAFKQIQFKAGGGTIDNTIPDDSDGGAVLFAPKYASGGAIHHGIKPLQWKAGGGWAKAGKAIQKAAQEAGALKAPQTAEKDLTTLQDFHTSLGDAVRARAMEAQKQMDSWDYKYSPGQHVFTEHGAKNNLPPLKILEKSRSGWNIVREDPTNPLSKKVIDPETGRAKRTPYEPGYKVRREMPNGDWSEFIIPESMIKGDVELRAGGLAHFDGGGAAIDQSAMGDDSPSKTRLMMEILARMAKEQGKEEIASLKKPRSVTDLANRGIVAPLAGAPVDIVNMGLEGIDFLREKATGKPVENRLASDKPFLGSEHLKDVMRQYGMTTDEERPMMETGLSMFSPSAAGVGKGVAKAGEAAQKGIRAGEAGLNAATAAVRRPFTPATITAEAVAPDLAKYKPRQWQETVTRRMTGEGAPVSMETMGGRKTTKRAGQGVYENFEGQLETNPLVTADVPFAGNLSTNKRLRADISQAGQDLAQESMAAHRFVPMATNEIKDASAMLIKTPKGLTNEQVIAMGERLPGMIVAHNPRLGGVVVMPYEVQKGIQPEFLEAQSVASSVLGKNAKFQYGKADPVKDRLYIERGDYATEGAKPSSAESKAMRERLKRGEARMFPARRQSQSGLGQVRESLATTAD